jgi:hypothetical protein
VGPIIQRRSAHLLVESVERMANGRYGMVSLQRKRGAIDLLAGSAVCVRLHLFSPWRILVGLVQNGEDDDCSTETTHCRQLSQNYLLQMTSINPFAVEPATDSPCSEDSKGRSNLWGRRDTSVEPGNGNGNGNGMGMGMGRG